MHRNARLSLIFVSLCAASALHAQQVAAPSQTPNTEAPQPRLLDTVLVVSGTQPGPGLWRAWKGDHALWILGTVSPLPSNMTWESAQVQKAIAESKEYVTPPSLVLSPKNVGMISGLFLLRDFNRAQKNPDGKKLKDVLPADVYARWAVAKKRYLPKDRDVEEKRPMLAAQELLTAAMRANGMGGKAIVTPVLNEAVKQHGLQTVSSSIRMEIENPKEFIREASTQQMDDVACMRKTLDVVEQHMPRFAERANAWAQGDIPRLRALPIGDMGKSCMEAFTESTFARKRNIVNMDARLMQSWVDKIEAAVAKNTVTFTTMPMDNLLGQGRALDILRNRGYEIEEP